MSSGNTALAASLASYLDRKILVLLRDGRNLLGTLRSFDRFANVVLEGAFERVIVGHLYSDIPHGLHVIRGENVVLIELTSSSLLIMKDEELDELPKHMTNVSAEEIRRVQKNASDLKGSMQKRLEFLDFD
ncbi:OLC1v1037925C1 [Oldenlandia corymbosa var. corymbosa]|uniref:U6 snRNA-associated Sm-like protein LSm1 n=1 Tax=Oldenlandia corymbosa var. corymbosa TaxID=529605 RepID=A0AAV1CZT8_OLDCO|nr:OLC1v1037925C1 [Oldenlandia corymbosa var. corymbosa]